MSSQQSEDRRPESAPPPGSQARREARLRQSAPAEIVLLRHGEPDWMPGGGLTVDDAALTERGRAQAEALGQALGCQRFDALYASPLRRAQETAQPLARTLGLPCMAIDELAEIGVRLGGLTQEEVDSYFRAATRRPLREHWEGWPGGESFHDFHARVTGAFRGILGRHGITPRREGDFTIWSSPSRPTRVAIVAHGGTNAVLLTDLLDVPAVPWEWMRFETELAAFSVLQARSIGLQGMVWSLQNFNEVSHLDARGLR